MKRKDVLTHLWLGNCLVTAAFGAVADPAAEPIALLHDSRGRPSAVSADGIQLAQGDHQEGSPQSRRSDTDARKSARIESARIEEVIVTAQRRQERLQDVPISITVLGGGDLDSSSVRGVAEALRAVPGVASFDGARAGAQLAIRGVTAGGAVQAGSTTVAYYLDDVSYGLIYGGGSVPDAKVYDLDRVEVLRGPQGTLYGASALNGVVRVLTKNPDLEGFELKVRASGSSTQDGGDNYRGDLAVNVPIIDGKLAVRGTVGYEDLGGWIDNPDMKNANSSVAKDMRLKLAAEPNDELSIIASAWVSRSDYDSSSLSGVGGESSGLQDGPQAVDYDVYSLRIEYAFPGFSVTSATSYLESETRDNIDTQSGQNGLYSLLGVWTQTHNSSDVFSEELNIRSTQNGVWKWSAGAMYRDDKENLFQNIEGLLVAPVDRDYRSKSTAIYGELTRKFLNGRLELTGGLRYFNDEVTAVEISRISGAPPLGPYAEDTFDATTPRAVITWHPSEERTVYASYSEGFRSGNGQPPSVLELVPDFADLKPDTLKNYEVGAKGTLWKSRVSFDAAVFYVDWQDVQQPLLVPCGNCGVPFISAMTNGGSASGAGFEIAATAAVMEGLTLGASFGWNDLTFDDDIYSRGLLLFPKDERLQWSPESTVGLSVDYATPLGSTGMQATISASGNYTSEILNRAIVGAEVEEFPSESYWLARAALSIEPVNGRWAVSLFADNVTDERAMISGAPGNQPNRYRYTRPRTVGLQFEYRL